jgi:thiol-disulfide isomerase/thioredoxin
MTRFLLFTLFQSFFLISQARGYEIKITVKGVKDSTCQLAYYFGDKQYIRDSARVDASGRMVFKGDEDLPGGIYLAVMPNKKYFELIVDREQQFSLETDTADFVGMMKIKGSKDNELFYDYLRWITAKGKEMESLRKEAELVKENKEQSATIREKQIALDKMVKDFKLKFIEEHPDLFLTKIFQASSEPEIPEAPMINGKKDSTFAYRYYKAHLFDKVDMKDDRLLRSPVLANKIKQYLEKLTAQVPDSINKAADYLIGLTNPTSDIFKYLVYYVTNTYEKSQVMGMDAVFVYMAKNYYLSGKAFWVDSTQLEKICDRVLALDPCLIGRKANPMKGLLKADFHPISLNEIKKAYTIVYFWDPSCGHCQKVTPKLKEFYDQQAKKYDLEVLGIYIEADTTEWFKYIREKQLNWINAADLMGRAQFRKYYDIYSTPVIYLLDREKRVIAKRLEVDQLEDFLDNHRKGRIPVTPLPDLVPFPCKPSDPSTDKH